MFVDVLPDQNIDPEKNKKSDNQKNKGNHADPFDGKILRNGPDHGYSQRIWPSGY